MYFNLLVDQYLWRCTPSPVKCLVAAWVSQHICSLAATEFRRPVVFCWELWLFCTWECIGSSVFSSQGKRLLWAWRLEFREEVSLLEWNEDPAVSRKEWEIGQLWEAKSQSIIIMTIIIIIYFPQRRGRNTMCWKGYALHSLQEESGSWKAAN